MNRTTKTKKPEDRLDTSNRIVDAAETLFARRGYYGASLRDITAAAEVPLSLCRYYFKNKDELFAEVLCRRAEETCGQLEIALEHALEKASAGDMTEKVVAAMVTVSAENLRRGDPGWRNYLLLLAQLGQLSEHIELLQPFRSRYTKTAARYRAALLRSLPDLDPMFVDLGMLFLQVLVAHAMLDMSTIRWLEGQAVGMHDPHLIEQQIVAYIVAGLRTQQAVIAPPK